MKLSDERLDELIAGWIEARNELPPEIRDSDDEAWFTNSGDTIAALRELLDYRKAVAEYLGALDNVRDYELGGVGFPKKLEELQAAFSASEATLRALQERT